MRYSDLVFLEINMINKSIKFFALLLLTLNVFGGGDTNQAYYENLDEELAAFEAQLEAELAAAEMMAEIEEDMARQAALEAFLQKLEEEKAAAAAATAAYRASLEDEVIGELVVEDEVIEVTEEAHEACKYALGLSDANIALFESALADGTLFNKGPQSSNGTEFGASRWDAYANCVSNYVNPF